MVENKPNIYAKIIDARVRFLKSNPKKSGKNSFQNYSYFELSDLIPAAIRICEELKIFTQIDMGSVFPGFATMEVINAENPEERVSFRIPLPEVNGKDINRNLQDIGRSETYLRRYLYMLFLDIAENDQVDAENNRPLRTRPRGRRADPNE